jgi:serine/threonine-protein kinase HipA
MVFAYLPGNVSAVPAGRLTVVEEGMEVIASKFGYGERYLRRRDAIPVDPVSLPLTDAEPGSVHEYEPKGGLPFFGAVRDAMPDAWGRRVIENWLKAPPDSLKESEYLRHAGSNRFGALDFRDTPTDSEQTGLLADVTELQRLVDAADRVQRNEPVPQELRRLFDAGPSMGGARPKAVVSRDGVAYVAKFPADRDTFNVPRIEHAVLELARLCGLVVPATDVITLPDGRDVMLIERFDRHRVRSGAIARRHVVSGLTLLGLHESDSPKSSYAALSLRLSEYGAANQVKNDRKELFGRMVFNILVSNDDDHLRNHAFLWDDKAGGWRLSPLYDVVPKPQIAFERFLHLGVGDEGRLATLDNALSGAGQFGLTTREAATSIDAIATRTRGWQQLFEKRLNIARKECELVASAFRPPDEIGFARVAALLKKAR